MNIKNYKLNNNYNEFKLLDKDYNKLSQKNKTDLHKQWIKVKVESK